VVGVFVRGLHVGGGRDVLDEGPETGLGLLQTRFGPLAVGDLPLRLLVEPGVVHGEGGPPGQLLGEPEVRLVVAPSRLG
jgi:hypothetical protein